MRFRVTLWAFFVCLAVGAGSAFAQSTTGEIIGRVTDSSDAVLPGVSVTLTGPSLLQPQTTSTSENGSFRFSRCRSDLHRQVRDDRLHERAS